MIGEASTNTRNAQGRGTEEVLGEVYGRTNHRDAERRQLVELSENLRRGVPVATPVFDGAGEADIVTMLKRRLDASGQGRCMTAYGRAFRPQGDRGL